MEITGVSIVILLFYGSAIVFAIVALIYFIIKRVEAKKKEDFQKRNN